MCVCVYVNTQPTCWVLHDHCIALTSSLISLLLLLATYQLALLKNGVIVKVIQIMKLTLSKCAAL